MSPETSDGSEDGAEATRFAQAIARFDQANAADPHREAVGGEAYPKELLYARRMTEWLDRLAPDASEPLRLAARCQHIRRWTIPRGTFPVGPDGYRAWRTTLADFHADTAAEILHDVGYDDETIARVRALLRKERLKADPDVQLLEDVICLVFFEHYLPAFAAEHDAAKLTTILRRTWRKMSERGRAAALDLDLSPDLRALVLGAIEPGPAG